MLPVVAITLAFALGIVLGTACLPGGAWAPGLTLLSFFSVLLAYLRGRRETPLLLFLAFTALGWLWYDLGRTVPPSSLSPFLDHQVEVSGLTCGLPVQYPDRVVYTISSPVVRWAGSIWRGQVRLQVVWYLPEQGGRSGGRYRVMDRPGLPEARVWPGTRIRAAGRLVLPQQPANPGDFDYRSFLLQKGIVAGVSAGQRPQTRGLEAGARYLLPRFFARLRWLVEDELSRALTLEESRLLQGFLLGSLEGITDEDRELYQETGVMHLFAVSGMNLGFVLVIMLVVARLLRLGKFPTFLLAAGGLWSYASITGFSPSVVRAAVMGSLAVAAGLLRERQEALNSLALAALVLLLSNPQSCLDPGFQLSFAATWGIISMAEPLGKLLLPQGDGRLLWSLRETLGVSLAAQLAVLPLCAWHFLRMPVLCLLTNLLVVPPAGLVVNLGLLGMFCSFIHRGWGFPFFQASGALALLIKRWLNILSGLPGSSWLVPPPPWWLLLLWYAVLALLSRSLNRGGVIIFPHFRYRSWPARWQLPSLAGLLLLTLAIYLGNPDNLWSPGRLMITFINVGQGDAVLVQSPEGHNLLVDAGGSQPGGLSGYDPGRRVVVPYLIRRGIRHLDLLVCTHPHSDHIGGVPAVLESIQVGCLVTPPWNRQDGALRELAGAAAARGVPVRSVRAGDRLVLGCTLPLAVLSPEGPSSSDAQADRNDSSLVLLIGYGGHEFLLTGDAGGQVLDRLAADRSWLPADGRVEVLKVPHHGSLTGICPELAAAVHPRWVVVSVGKNSFGHPADETLAFWRDQGSRVLRTDQMGPVVFISDGRRLWLQLPAQSPKEIPMARAA